MATAFQSCIVSQKPNMAFFDNPYYDVGDAKFVSVNVPTFLAKSFVKKALREDGKNSEEIIALIKKVKKVKVLTVVNGNPKMLADFSKYLNENNYQDWLSVNSNGQKVEIKALQPKEDIIKKLMLTVHDGNNLVFVYISGKFSADDISKIIDGAQKADFAKRLDNSYNK